LAQIRTQHGVPDTADRKARSRKRTFVGHPTHFYSAQFPGVEIELNLFEMSDLNISNNCKWMPWTSLPGLRLGEFRGGISLQVSIPDARFAFLP
jgi:hypothetical protein